MNHLFLRTVRNDIRFYRRIVRAQHPVKKGGRPADAPAEAVANAAQVLHLVKRVQRKNPSLKRAFGVVSKYLCARYGKPWDYSAPYVEKLYYKALSLEVAHVTTPTGGGVIFIRHGNPHFRKTSDKN